MMSRLNVFTRAALSAAAAVLLAAGAGAAQQPAPPAAGATAASAPDRAAPCPAPAKDLVAQGKKIFAGAGNCTTCHGPDAKGTPLAPNLTDKTWLNIDGSYPAIAKLIQSGVPHPKSHPAPMPPMGGAQLSTAQLCAVGAYVYSLSHALPASK